MSSSTQTISTRPSTNAFGARRGSAAAPFVAAPDAVTVLLTVLGPGWRQGEWAALRELAATIADGRTPENREQAAQMLEAAARERGNRVAEMTLITTPPRAIHNADSYASIAEADAYFSALGNLLWTATNAFKEVFLRRARGISTTNTATVWNRNSDESNTSARNGRGPMACGRSIASFRFIHCST